MYGYLDADNNVIRTADFKLAKAKTNGVSKKLREDYVSNYYISTVFLIIDAGDNEHSTFFETSIFPTQSGKVQFSNEVYSIKSNSYDNAIKAHKIAVEMANDGTLSELLI